MTKIERRENRRNMRAFIYAFIPLGFLALVGTMVFFGNNTTGPANGIGEMGPAERALQTSEAPPLYLGDVADPEVETNTVETQDLDRYRDQAGTVTPTPSGPEGGDNRTIIE